jgi:hypothetical protein
MVAAFLAVIEELPGGEDDPVEKFNSSQAL